MNLVCSLLVILFVKRIFGDEVISTDSSPLFRRNNTEPDIPHRRIYTMPEIPFQRNYTGPHVPFQRTYTGPHVPFQQTYTGQHVPFQPYYTVPQIPFQQNYTGPQIPFQGNQMQPDVLRERVTRLTTRRMRAPVTFKTLNVYRHVTDPIWEFEEIDFNFVEGRLYRQQHDCIGVNINCVMDRMFIRPICVANYYKKYTSFWAFYKPKKMLSICEMDYRNCVYRQSWARHGQYSKGVYGTSYHDADLEITGEHEEVPCLAYAGIHRLD